MSTFWLLVIITIYQGVQIQPFNDERDCKLVADAINKSYPANCIPVKNGWISK